MQPQIDQTNALHRDQMERRTKLLADLGAQRLTDEAIAAIMQFARDVKEGIANPDFAAKRRMLEALGVKVVVKDGRYFMTCLLGKTNGKITRIDRRFKGSVVTCASTPT